NNGYDYFASNISNYPDTDEIFEYEEFLDAYTAGMKVDGYFTPYLNDNMPPDWQLTNAAGILQLLFNNSTIPFIWIDIDPNTNWSQNKTINQQVLQSMINASYDNPDLLYNDTTSGVSIPIGIRSSYNAWDRIFGLNYVQLDATGLKLPLWWIRWNGKQDLGNDPDWKDFGGWTKGDIIMHQYAGNVQNTQCNLKNLNYNFYLN
uniref:Uncharacterized protein n=1 Tax=Acrobeloides nanus TaxID=290746 RepID=A0A914DLF5_9BILA